MRVNGVILGELARGHIELVQALAMCGGEKTPAVLGEGQGADSSLMLPKRLQPASLIPQQMPLETAQVLLVRPRSQSLEQGPQLLVPAFAPVIANEKDLACIGFAPALQLAPPRELAL